VRAMNETMFDLMQRRRKLLEKISVQREQLAEISSELQSPLLLADKGVSVARFLRFHPMLVAGIAALFVMRKRSVAGLVWVAWSAWKVFRDITSISVRLFSRD